MYQDDTAFLRQTLLTWVEQNYLKLKSKRFNYFKKQNGIRPNPTHSLRSLVEGDRNPSEPSCTTAVRAKNSSSTQILGK